MFSINCQGKLITTEKALVMGIINVTGESFYKGSRQTTSLAALTRIKEMINEGADIIDIGGQSTKPGSKRLSSGEELERIHSVITETLKDFPETIISVDTYHSEVAKVAISAGCSIINDISGGEMDKNMLPLVAELQVPYICMHMQGTPEMMQLNPYYKNVTREVLDFFIHKADQCNRMGINDLIIDPGFGFGKTITHNFELLRNLDLFNMLGKPVMAGLSRKSTIYRVLGTSPEEALNGTTVLHSLALNNGASILRVHDVKEAKEAVKLFEAYKS